MKRYRPLVLAVGLLLAADAPKSDQEKLQGTWTVVTVEVNGKERSPERTERLKVVFKDRKIIFKGQTADEEMTFKIDPSQKVKQMDLTHPDKKVGTLLGIYAFQGDTLKICYGRKKDDRPEDFGTREGDACVLIVLKKE